jgi:phosphoribosylformimino-5-aminoimidazole carboxamide ribotide isomerase
VKLFTKSARRNVFASPAPRPKTIGWSSVSEIAYLVTMITIPTIALRGGTCVSNTRADVTDANLSVRCAVSLARTWAATGFPRVHVADLDALSGSGSNASVIDDIVRDGAIGIQAASGACTTEAVDRLFDAGAARVVLDIAAVDEPSWLEIVADSYPGSVVVATDVRERRVVTRGWVRNLPVNIFDVVDELHSLPLGGLMISGVHGNGSSSAADLSLLEDIAEACEFPVMTVGGVLTMNDLRALEHRGVSAVVLDHVLYSGTLDARAVAQEFNS